MWPKSLIFILNVLFAQAYFPLISAQAAANPSQSPLSNLSKNKAARAGMSQMTQAGLPIRLVWQVIRSQGVGGMMNTSTETHAAEGQILQVGSSHWELRIKNVSMAGYLVSPKTGIDGRIVLLRSELLELLGVDTASQGRTPDSEDAVESKDLVQIILSEASNRQFETIYRGPEEELFLIKLSASVMR